MDEVQSGPSGGTAQSRRSLIEGARALLALGVLLGLSLRVRAPFFGVLLWTGILTLSGWRLATRLADALGERRTLAAGIIACIYVVVLALPLLYLSITIDEVVQDAWTRLASIAQHGLPAPPAFLHRIPGIGKRLVALWREDQRDLPALLDQSQGALFVVGEIAVRQLSDLATSLGELGFGILLTFQLLAAGPHVPPLLHRAAMLLGGQAGVDALEVTSQAVRVVALGIIGGALVEAVLSGVGFWLTGLSLVPLLALACFVLRLLQIGPWPVWIVCLIWLWWQGDHGAALALFAWVVVVVAGTGMVLKHRLIAARLTMPRTLLFLAVLGGPIAWGFTGMFLGAAAVSVAWTLMRHWLDASRDQQEVDAKIAVMSSTTGPDADAR